MVCYWWYGWRNIKSAYWFGLSRFLGWIIGLCNLNGAPHSFSTAHSPGSKAAAFFCASAIAADCSYSSEIRCAEAGEPNMWAVDGWTCRGWEWAARVWTGEGGTSAGPVPFWFCPAGRPGRPSRCRDTCTSSCYYWSIYGRIIGCNQVSLRSPAGSQRWWAGYRQK